ncbi:MAG TPA: diguanylate cyclase [Solirubrobacteraceae bacterium]|nr:diguanylate cyclase [Solirubrobacteraceae bacterium]
MTTTTIALGSALAATLLVVAIFLLGRRTGGSADARLDAVAAQIDERMQAMVRDLSEALERAQEENRRTRVLGELSATIDLEEVITRTLDAARSLPGVDAAVVAVGDADDSPVSAAGLGPGEPAGGIAGPPDGSQPRSIAVEYTYDAAETQGAAPIRAALAVPLGNQGEQLGYLSAYSRTGLDAFGDAGMDLEELAHRAGPAIDNARRFREARQLADLDALTGLHNRRYFHETLAREVARAHRYNRSLALVVFDLDDFKAVNDRIGHLAGDVVLAEAAERVRDVVRSADVACRVGGDEFAVILPESTLKDADQLYRRLEQAISVRPVGQAGRLHLSAGVTELRPDDDTISFFERADEALYRAKGAGKGTVVAVETPTSFPREAPGTASSS